LLNLRTRIARVIAERVLIDWYLSPHEEVKSPRCDRIRDNLPRASARGAIMTWEKTDSDSEIAASGRDDSRARELVLEERVGDLRKHSGAIAGACICRDCRDGRDALWSRAHLARGNGWSSRQMSDKTNAARATLRPRVGEQSGRL
jgi:hypothetical protein